MFELYNLKDDISESVNLALKYPEIVKDLQEEMNDLAAKNTKKITKTKKKHSVVPR